MPPRSSAKSGDRLLNRELSSLDFTARVLALASDPELPLPENLFRMRVAVIDVGSNTIRLLVAEQSRDGMRAFREGRAAVGLGAEIERIGRLSRGKLEEAARSVRAFVQEARALGCARVEVVVASPGRQAENAGRLVRELARATATPVRVLSREKEAGLAYAGAVAAANPAAASVAVCDVGGGSTQIAFGVPGGEPAWLRSVDIGALRLAARTLRTDPPGKRALAAARAEARREFDGLAVPLPKAALAVGDSARALRKIVGKTLGPGELREAASILRKTPAEKVSAAYGIVLDRVRTLAAGAVILTEVQRRLGVPLEVVRAGLREGLALTLMAEELPATQPGRTASG